MVLGKVFCVLSFLPHTADRCVRSFSGFFHKYQLCQNMKCSFNCAVSCVSKPSPKRSVTLVPNPIKSLRKSGCTRFKSAHTLHGLSIAYKTHLLRDATQPSAPANEGAVGAVRHEGNCSEGQVQKLPALAGNKH